MKKPTCLILTLVGVLLFIIGLVVVVPWFVDIFKEFGEMTEQHGEYSRSLRELAHQSLTLEQEELLSQLLGEHGVQTDQLSPDDLESILSTELYLSYLTAQDGQVYSDYAAYINAMPTQTHRTFVMSNLTQFLDDEVVEAEQRIWLDFYYRIRQWSKDGNTQLNKRKEFRDLLQKHLVEPLMEDESIPEGFSTKFVKMGFISAFMLEDNEVYHRAWNTRIQTHGQQAGYLRNAITSPAEFALLRSFFDNADAFVNWMSEPFGIDEESEGTENP